MDYQYKVDYIPRYFEKLITEKKSEIQLGNNDENKNSSYDFKSARLKILLSQNLEFMSKDMLKNYFMKEKNLTGKNPN